MWVDEINYNEAECNRKRIVQLQKKEKRKSELSDIDVTERNAVVEKHYRRNRKMLQHKFAWLGAWAEDAVHDAYIKALIHYNKFDPEREGGFDAWFNMIVVNCANDARNSVEDDEEHENAPNWCPPVQEDTVTIQEIESRLKGRTDLCGQVLREYFMYGCTAKEIAEVLPVKEQVVWNMVSEFRKELEEC